MSGHLAVGAIYTSLMHISTMVPHNCCSLVQAHLRLASNLSGLRYRRDRLEIEYPRGLEGNSWQDSESATNRTSLWVRHTCAYRRVVSDVRMLQMDWTACESVRGSWLMNGRVSSASVLATVIEAVVSRAAAVSAHQTEQYYSSLDLVSSSCQVEACQVVHSMCWARRNVTIEGLIVGVRSTVDWSSRSVSDRARFRIALVYCSWRSLGVDVRRQIVNSLERAAAFRTEEVLGQSWARSRLEQTIAFLQGQRRDHRDSWMALCCCCDRRQYPFRSDSRCRCLDRRERQCQLKLCLTMPLADSQLEHRWTLTPGLPEAFQQQQLHRRLSWSCRDDDARGMASFHQRRRSVKWMMKLSRNPFLAFLKR